jgi:hypothetical protein
MDLNKILSEYDEMFGRFSLQEIEGFLLKNLSEARFKFEKGNWGVESSFSNTIGFNGERNVNHSYNANLDTRYAWDKLKLQSSFSVNLQESTDDSSQEPTMRTISQSFYARYNNLRANIGEDIVTLKKEGTPDETTYTTKADVGYRGIVKIKIAKGDKLLSEKVYKKICRENAIRLLKIEA